MINTLPYSTEAVDDLVALEREHIEQTLEQYKDRRPFKYVFPQVADYIGNKTLCLCCSDSIRDISKIILYPCPTLITVRTSASTETKVMVALILGGENGSDND